MRSGLHEGEAVVESKLEEIPGRAPTSAGCANCGVELPAGKTYCATCGEVRIAQVDAALTGLRGEGPDGQAKVRPKRREWITHTLLLALVGLQVFTMLDKAPPPRRVEWEYKVELYDDGHWKFSSMGPNADGAQGWEIISARRATSDYSSPKYEVILKRPR